MNEQQDDNKVEQLPEKGNLVKDSVLNTPPKDPINLQEIVPDRILETHMESINPKPFEPKSDVVLDMGGNKTRISSPDDSTSTALQKILGESDSVKGTDLTGIYVIFGAMLIFLIIIIVMNQKRTNYILKLEKDIDKLKRDRISSL